MVFERKELAWCCGYDILGAFIEEFFNTKEKNYYKEEVDRDLKSYFGKNGPFNKCRYGGVIITLIDEQRFLVPTLRKHGFRKIGKTFVNPKTRNKIYTYQYTRS